MARLFDEEMKVTLRRIREVGIETGYAEMTLSHFLVALLENAEFTSGLSCSRNIDLEVLLESVRSLIGTGPGLSSSGDVTMSPDSAHVFQRAVDTARGLGKPAAGRIDFLKAVVDLAQGDLRCLIEDSGLKSCVEPL